MGRGGGASWFRPQLCVSGRRPQCFAVSAPQLSLEVTGDSQGFGWPCSRQTSAEPPLPAGCSRRHGPGRGGKWRRHPEASGRSCCCSVGPDLFPGSFSSPRLSSSCCRPPRRASAPRPAPAAHLCWTAVAGNCQRRAGGCCRARCPPTPPACEWSCRAG